MKEITKFKLFGLGLLICILFLPQSSSAYGVIDETAQIVNKNTVLYTITYKFGFLNRETYLPIATVRATLDDKRSSYAVGYEILNDGEYYGLGNTVSLVLSEAKIKNNLYYIPEGKSGEFKLVTLLYLPEGVNASDFVMKINRLPLILDDDGDKTAVLVEGEKLLSFITQTPK